MLKQIKGYVEEGVHPQTIMRNIRSASKLAVEKVQELSIPYDTSTPQGEQMLLKCASMALNSKLISSHQNLFSPMIVSAEKGLHDANHLDDVNSLIAIKKILGGDVRQSFLVNGVAFNKTSSYLYLNKYVCLERQ